MPLKATQQRDLAWLTVLWIIVTAYNLFKPYHIDDAAHLEIARWIAEHPFKPMSGILNWSGVDEPIHITNQPHLFFYLLAGWGTIFGYSEVSTHLLQSLFSLGCIFLFFQLASCVIGARALWATAILTLGPAFIVQQNLMVDIPLLALWLGFFYVLICLIEAENQHWRFVASAIFCSAAFLTKYSSLTLIVILVLALFLERRWAQIWTLLIPIGTIAAWSLFNFLDYGGVHIASRPSGEGRSLLRIAKEAVAWVLAIGALTPLGIIVLARSRAEFHKWELWIYAFVVFALGVPVFAVGVGALSDGRSDQILWGGFLVNGIALGLALAPKILTTLARAWRLKLASDRDSLRIIYLALWIIGTSGFYISLAPFIASRHVLLIIPALTLLFLVSWGNRLSTQSQTFGLAFTIIISAGLCLSDWRFANFYKIQAVEIAGSVRGNGRMWASGHWGWQEYAQQQGMRQVDVRASDLSSGDYFIVADNVDHQALKRPVELERVRTVVQGQPLLNILCTGRPARFYASDFANGPWSISRNCVGQITIFRVK